jgi:hypothetical protein
LITAALVLALLGQELTKASDAVYDEEAWDY